MSDYTDRTYDDQIVRGAFTEFRAEAGDRTSTQNLDGVHAIARHRRRVHTMTVSAVATVLLAVPLGGYAATVHRQPAPVAPVPAQSTSPSPSPSASPTPSPSSPAPVVVAPDGRFTIDQLSHMTVYLPPWPKTSISGCPSGKFTFNGNPTKVYLIPDEPQSFRFVQLDKVAYVDADRDGAMETATLIDCYIQGGDQQVVVFDRDASGQIVTIGRVIVSGGEQAAVQYLFDVRPAANGKDVEVQVGDDHPCCGVTSDMVEHQWRGYRWNGRSFYQVSGPTKFTPATKPNDLAVTSTALKLGAVSNGVRTGTITVTVTNKGPAKAPGWVATVTVHAEPPLDRDVLMAGPSGSVYTPPDSYVTTLVYHGPALAKGASRSFTVTFTVSQLDDPAIPVTGTSTQVGSHVTVAEEQPGVRVLWDPNGADNDADIPITRPA